MYTNCSIHFIIIIVLLIISIYFIISNIINNKNIINGFWSASEEYCIHSHIDYMWLFINNNLGWIIINYNNKDVINQVTKLHIKFNVIHNFLFNSQLNGYIVFEDINNKLLDNSFPSKFYFTLYPYIGRLVLYYDYVYADLYKNGFLTYLSKNINY